LRGQNIDLPQASRQSLPPSLPSGSSFEPNLGSGWAIAAARISYPLRERLLKRASAPRWPGLIYKVMEKAKLF
jgi:hypothetical protein